MKNAWMGNAICVAVCAVICVGCAEMETSSRPAVGPQSSWEEIRGIRDVILKPPTIAFGARSVSVMDVCRSGDTLRATAGDGTTLERPAAGIPRDYQVGVGRLVGDAETSSVRILFYKPFAIPACNEPRSEIPLRPNALRRGRESGAEGIGPWGPRDTDRGLRGFPSTGARIEGRGQFSSGLFFRIGASRRPRDTVIGLLSNLRTWLPRLGTGSIGCRPLQSCQGYNGTAEETMT